MPSLAEDHITPEQVTNAAADVIRVLHEFLVATLNGFKGLEWWLQILIVFWLYGFFKKMFPANAPKSSVDAQTSVQLVTRLANRNADNQANQVWQSRHLFSLGFGVTIGLAVVVTFVRRMA